MEKLVEKILAAAAEKRPVIVLDGMCGSGKTTLAGALQKRLGLPIVHMDDFFLPFHLRTAERLSQPGGNVDYERFAKDVLPNIGRGEAFTYQRFHCGDGTFSPVFCPAEAGCIVEGSYSLHPAFYPEWQKMGAVTVFLQVEEAEQLRRLEKRNPEMMENFRRRWIPMENAYFAAFDVPHKARLCLKSEWTAE